MKKWLLLVGVLAGCGQKTSVTVYDLSKSGSGTATYSLSDAGLSYTSSDVTVTSSVIRLATKYTTLYDFAAGTDSAWSAHMTAPGGAFSSGPTFTGFNLSFASITNWVGVANIASTVQDYIMMADFNASVFDASNTVSLCMRAQSNLDDHYRFSLASGTLDISSRAGSAFTSLATAASSLTPAANTTYHIKASAIGTALGFRVWDATASEPSADQVTVTDATYSSGYPCLMMQAGITATLDNIRIGSSTYTSDYAKTNPTVTFPAVELRAGLSAFTTTITASGSDDIRFELSTDNGSTYKVWSGSAWVTNTAGRASANSLSTFSTNLTSLSLPSSNLGTAKVIIRAYLHSDLGYTTPSMTAPVLTYK